MNSCQPYQELISRLVDGELSREEHAALMAHMESCSSCNAMYAVFHDLSDILTEESVPLPEGLHENIMAGVRRSDMIKKNRRLRKFGLRTALSAAACALLVLFAASGFGPGRRAESVSIRSEEAAGQLYQAPAASAPADYVAARDVYLAPFDTEAPLPVPTPAPARTPEPARNEAPARTPVTPDAYLDAAPAETPYQPPFELWSTPAPEAWSAAPAETAAPEAWNADPAETPAPVEAESGEAAGPMLFSARSARENSPASETFENAAPEAGETPAPDEAESGEPEEGVSLFSVASGEGALYGSDSPEAEADTAQAEAVPAPEESAAPVGAEADPPAGELPAAAPVEAERIDVYGRENRDRLLALLGGGEDVLPEGAELTRLLHVSLVPEDAYGSAEKLDIRVYGDFVYYELSQAEGGVRCFRADCALRELDSLLKACAASAPGATPQPASDPYAEGNTIP